MQSEAQIRKRLEWLQDYLRGAQDRLKVGLDALRSPYLPASGYQGYDEYTDDLYDLIKAIRGGIYELELILEGKDEEASEGADEE